MITDAHKTLMSMRKQTTVIGTVDIFIASMPRNFHILKTIESLINQPDLNKIFLICNCYDDKQYKYVLNQLHTYRNIIIFRRDNRFGCSERFFPMQMSTSKYIAFADDDLIYPETYLADLIRAADKYKALVSFHGCILFEGEIKNYYKDRKCYRCLGTVENDFEVDIVGVGASLCERALFSKIGVENYYSMILEPNMDDIYYSYLAAQNGIKRYVIAHSEGYLQHKVKEPGDNYIFDKKRKNCEPQTNFVNEYFK